MITSNKIINIEVIVTYENKHTKVDQLMMNTVIKKDATTEELIKTIVHSLIKYKKINSEDNILKLDCTSKGEFLAFKNDNGNYFRRNKEWFVGYGGKLPNEFYKPLVINNN